MSCSNSAHACWSTVRSWTCTSRPSISTWRWRRGVAEPALAGGQLAEVPVVADHELVGEQVGDDLDVAGDEGDDADAEQVADVAQRVGVERAAVDRAARLLRERGDALGPARDAQVVDAGLVEDPDDQVDRAAPGLLEPAVVGGVGPDRGRRDVGDQRRRDDVARGQVAVAGGALGPPVREQRDVRAHHGVDLVLGHPEVALAGRVDDRVPQRRPRAGRAAAGLHQPLDVVHQREQLAPQELEVAALLLLVLQGPLEAEQHDRGGVRVDLDGAALRLRVGVEVESQERADPRAPGAVRRTPACRCWRGARPPRTCGSPCSAPAPPAGTRWRW